MFAARPDRSFGGLACARKFIETENKLLELEIKAGLASASDQAFALPFASLGEDETEV